MTHIPLEVCVDSIEGARTAADNGADRIELCAALSEGGLTPSFGLMSAAAELQVPVYAMIRPRGGDFRYSDAEKTVMLHDIEAAAQAGLAGIVIGAIDNHSRLDHGFLEHALSRSALPATLHRAIDTLPIVEQAIEDAIALGFERVLTSGGADKAEFGLETLARAVQVAGGRLSVMAGSGVSAANAARILRHAGVSELHASCSSWTPSPERPETQLGYVPDTGTKKTDANLVQALRHAMDLHAEDAA